MAGSALLAKSAAAGVYFQTRGYSDGFAKKALYALSPSANLTAVSDRHGAAKVLGLMRVSSSGCVANGGILTPWPVALGGDTAEVLLQATER